MYKVVNKKTGEVKTFPLQEDLCKFFGVSICRTFGFIKNAYKDKFEITKEPSVLSRPGRKYGAERRNASRRELMDYFKEHDIYELPQPVRIALCVFIPKLEKMLRVQEASNTYERGENNA